MTFGHILEFNMGCQRQLSFKDDLLIVARISESKEQYLQQSHLISQIQNMNMSEERNNGNSRKSILVTELGQIKSFINVSTIVFSSFSRNKKIAAIKK